MTLLRAGSVALKAEKVNLSAEKSTSQTNKLSSQNTLLSLPNLHHIYSKPQLNITLKPRFKNTPISKYCQTNYFFQFLPNQEQDLPPPLTSISSEIQPPTHRAAQPSPLPQLIKPTQLFCHVTTHFPSLQPPSARTKRLSLVTSALQL